MNFVGSEFGLAVVWINCRNVVVGMVFRILVRSRLTFGVWIIVLSVRGGKDGGGSSGSIREFCLAR